MHLQNNLADLVMENNEVFVPSPLLGNDVVANPVDLLDQLVDRLLRRRSLVFSKEVHAAIPSQCTRRDNSLRIVPKMEVDPQRPVAI